MTNGRDGAEGGVQDAIARLRELSASDPEGQASTVRRLSEEVASAFANPELADATDIVQWADRPEASTALPEVVRRLVLASSGVVRARFRSGEGVRYPGWDGVVEATSGAVDPFIPLGQSLWEIGTSRDARRKADADLKTRSAALSDEERGDAAFVFVTPRRWAHKDEWASQQISRYGWRDLRIYDADDLEAWLQITPSVHYWFSERLGKRPSAATSLDSWWREWSDATSPATPPELVVAGREAQADELARRFEDATGVDVLQAESVEEAVAFIAAAAKTSDADPRWRYRAVVVRTGDAWERLRMNSGLVLIPMVDVQVTQQDSSRHLVIIPTSRGLGPALNALLVPRIMREAAESALREMGFEGSELQQLSLLARRSLLVLRRRIAVSPRLRAPEWANAADADVLIPMIWCGAWDERREGDRAVLARLANVEPDRIIRSLVGLATQADFPVRKVGDIWYIISRDDAWYALMRFVREDHVARLVQVAIEVLSQADPKLSLPIEDRWQSSLLGVESRDSDVLREGLSEGLAFLGSRASSDDIAGETGASLVERVVSRILAAANDDTTGTVWSSVSTILPMLAEAAPDAFFDALEFGLRSDSFRAIFQDTTGDFFGSSSSPHTGFLWALEDLAWFREHLLRASLALVRLAAIDPGGRLSNRPSASLREIFLPWHPSTTATIEERLDVLATLRDRFPDVSWALLVGLLPKNHDIASPTYQPRIRALSEQDRPVTRKDVYDFTSSIMPWLLHDVGADGSRWADLIDAVDDLYRDLAERVVDSLRDLSPESLSDEARLVVWGKLRETINHHRSYPDAEWVMPEELLSRLEESYSRFQPDDVIDRSVWLFASHPPIPERGSSWEAYLGQLRRARQAAVADVLGEDGLQGVEQLATLVERPDEVGVALGSVISEEADALQRETLAELLAEDERIRLIGAGYAIGRFEQHGWAFADSVLDGIEGWPARSVSQFLLALPAEPRTWGYLERFGDDAAAEYWRMLNPLAVRNDADVPTAVNQFIRFGRPLAAVDLLGHRVDAVEPAFDAELVTSTLEAAMKADTDEFRSTQSLSYVVERLLTFLDDKEVNLQRLARIEWFFLPLLSEGARKSSTLHKFLAEDPAFFVSAISMIYKAEGESREATSEDQARARLAYELLRSWHMLPGSREDGTIDSDALDAWIDEARALAENARRGKIADQHIGNVFRYAPGDRDGSWPPAVVRDVIERVSSPDVETGLMIEVFNSRGATTRSLSEGGGQEHELAQRYFSYATKLGTKWPRTRLLLRRIGDSFEADAKREDEEANLRQDLN